MTIRASQRAVSLGGVALIGIFGLASLPAHAQVQLAAVVVGADKVTKVDPGQPGAPAAAAPGAQTPPPGGPGAGLRRRKAKMAGQPTGAPGVPGAPGAPAVPTPPAATPPAPTPPGAVGAPSGPDLPGEAEFNSCKKFPPNKRIVKLNLKPETELGDLISWISSITCKQFLLPGTIPANSKKVTIVAPQLITPEEAYRLFLAALDSVGLTVEPSGKFLRIIETMKAKSTNIPVYGPDATVPHSEGYVTRLIRVDNSDPNEVAQVLGRLKSEQGDLIVYPPQGALILTDTAGNIQRMMRILNELDQPGTGEKIWIVKIHNIAATEMAQRLAEIFSVTQVGGKKGGGAPPPAPGGPGVANRRTSDLSAEMAVSKIIPDERSNQLIVIASEKAYARLLTLIKRLDVAIEGGDGRIHVYYCANANCDELAQTLGAITGVPVSGAMARGTTRSRTSTPAPAPAAMPGGQQGQQASYLFEGEVRITFDRPTNSLVVLSSLKDYQALRRVIERLDSPRKQVFIEALILEVTLDKTRDLGASFHGAKPHNLLGLDDPSLILGGLNPNKTLFPVSSLQEQMLAGVLGPVLSSADARSLGQSSTAALDIPSFGVLIKALQTNSDVDVVSNPHLLIMNNEEGEISVGSRVPFPVSTIGLGGMGAAAGATGAAGLAGFGLGSLYPQVQREKVAMELKLTPHVNEHDMIRLEVEEKISELAPSGDSRFGPSTSERTAKTMVMAKDQQTILIGGLMSDKVVSNVTKIPILGDIPILGFFFRTSQKKTVKTNLIIALTPYVIADQSDLRRVLEKKMKERREFAERFGQSDRPEPTMSLDYRRKRGMLEEINRAAREVEDEEAQMQMIRDSELRDESGAIEVPPGFRVGPASGSEAPAAAPAPPPPPPARAPRVQ